MKLSSLTKENILCTLRLLAAAPLALAPRKKRNSVWLITERPDQARDNGYVFFRYMRTAHPEMPVYYIIRRNAPDRDKVLPYGNVIDFNSWKHFRFYCLSRIHISAHVGGCCPDNGAACRRLKKLLGVRDVFLPHGVSYGVSEFCLKKYTNIDLFICSGKPEYDNVLANYGYSREEVAYTGFPRLDLWHNITVDPKQLVLMPTWRLYLAQDPDAVFEDSAFFRAYQSLLSDRTLAEYLEANDLRLVFYLHNDMRRYADAFSTDCPRIEIVRRDGQHDIQELLKSAALLITDYSSVHFDFAYMGKPVIYYQFDREEFFARQYRQASFDAERDGFGPVAHTEEELLDALREPGGGSFSLRPPYLERMQSFYPLHDEHNCERVYTTIMERLIHET